MQYQALFPQTQWHFYYTCNDENYYFGIFIHAVPYFLCVSQTFEQIKSPLFLYNTIWGSEVLEDFFFFFCLFIFLLNTVQQRGSI